MAAPYSRDSNKLRAYRQLVQERKSCRACDDPDDLRNPSDCEEGQYDSEHIGPWSTWQGNLDATVLVIGQDWADLATFKDSCGRDTIENQTNKVLVQLLRSAGIFIDPDNDGGCGPVFLTNAVLCLKTAPKMGAPIKPRWVTTCGDLFLKRTIELVAAPIVITLGEWAYSSVAHLYGLPSMPFRTAVETTEGFGLPGSGRLFPMYHCGARVVNTHRPLDQQREDWRRVRVALKRPAENGRHAAAERDSSFTLLVHGAGGTFCATGATSRWRW